MRTPYIGDVATLNVTSDSISEPESDPIYTLPLFAILFPVAVNDNEDAIGASFTLVIVRFTRAPEETSTPSDTWKVKLSDPK